MTHAGTHVVGFLVGRDTAPSPCTASALLPRRHFRSTFIDGRVGAAIARENDPAHRRMTRPVPSTPADTETERER
jgi:hypothetical protein